MHAAAAAARLDECRAHRHCVDQIQSLNEELVSGLGLPPRCYSRVPAALAMPLRAVLLLRCSGVRCRVARAEGGRAIALPRE